MNRLLQFWLIGAFIYGASVSFRSSTLLEILTPLFVCIAIVLLATKRKIKGLDYVLFFTISVTSLLGITKTLTGSHAAGTCPFPFGLSFYGASLAYLYRLRQATLTKEDAVQVSNPLLLATGPIALYVKDISHIKLLNRLRYFVPFVVIGVFFYQIIAAPLTVYLSLIQRTDIASSITFAIIFELFVYANFCGLSLLIYGLLGVVGFRVPLNFRQPFSSDNVIDFWRGWHTSLSAVLKALFYGPIRSKFSTVYALFGVYLASALWHGVTRNFILWGLFHALMFVLTIKVLKRKWKLVPTVILILAVVLGRLIFADSNFDRLLEKLSFQFSDFGVFEILMGVPMLSKIALALGLVLISIEFFFRNCRLVRKRTYKHLRLPLSQLVLVCLIVLLAMDIGGDYAVYGQR